MRRTYGAGLAGCPRSRTIWRQWLEGHRERVRAKRQQVELYPVIVEFQELIDTDPVVRMYMDQMIAQVPTTKLYNKRHLEDVEEMLRLINELLRMAPEFGEDIVDTPLGAILDSTMGRRLGSPRTDRRINGMLKKILNAWCEFLSSGESLYVLNDSPTGWKAGAAQRAVGMEPSEHDPQDEHWGFASWNDFFTRRFKTGELPVAPPDDNNVIVSACESTSYGISTEVKDAVEPMNSQSYLAHVATRAIILIEADDPVIGLMAFVAVGMLEVSSCVTTRR